MVMMKTRKAFVYLLIMAFIGFACQSRNGWVNDNLDVEVIQTIMSGLSNQSGQGVNPYLTAGDKTYIIGTQDGNFPDLGSHVPNEMGGVWNHMIKLLDGFWLQVKTDGSDPIWLAEASSYTNYPYGSEFTYSPIGEGVHVNRFQFCPQGLNGVVVTYTFDNQSSMDQVLTVDFVAKTDISPVWSSDQIDIMDAADTIEWDATTSLFKAHDLEHEWNTVWGSTEAAVANHQDVPTYIQTAGKGKSASSSYQINLPKGESKDLAFVITGSIESMEEAVSIYQQITGNISELLRQKKELFANILQRGQISIPDKQWQEVYNWMKVQVEWLAADLDGVGRFLGAGAIEYPWLFGCDNSYALQGVVASGDHALAESTLRVIKNMSEQANGNGRILHEMAFNAFVSNKGNTQETAHFINAVWNVFHWTGNLAFLSELYPYMKKGIDFLLTEMDTNGNMFPEGYGIMEVRGLNAELIDVSVYTQQALEAMTEIAKIQGELELSTTYASQAAELKARINDKFWDEEAKTYCDFYGTREQALQTTKGAIEQVRQDTSADPALSKRHIALYEAMYKQFEQYPAGTEKGWLTNKNWVISTPIETHIAPAERAIPMLDKVRAENCGEYGPFLSAVEQKHMMTISTGVQAMAECAYGRIDESLWYIDRIISTFGRTLPGAISEMMPDYGCPVQAWTIYGIATPLIRYIFGIQPEAYKQTMTLCPHLPTGWNEITIKDLPVGDNNITYSVRRTDEGLILSIESKILDWKYIVESTGEPIKRFILNGKEQAIGEKQKQQQL